MSACCAVCSKKCGGTLLAIRCLCCGALNTTLISVFLAIYSFLYSIPVHWPVYSVGLWLLRHYQGDRPKESNRPHQTARQHRRDSREHWFQCKLKVAVICSAGQLSEVPVLILCVCAMLVFMQKHPAPEDWLYKEARGLFLKPEVVDCSTVELKWNEPDEEGLIQFMCEEKQFRWTKYWLILIFCFTYLLSLTEMICCCFDFDYTHFFV